MKSKLILGSLVALFLAGGALAQSSGPISGFTEITEAASDDELAIVDKSDTPPATGNTRKITAGNLWGGIGLLGFGTPEAETISSGAITPSKTFVEITSEGGSGADDLDTITISGIAEGDFVIVKAASGSTPTVKDGTGNLNLSIGDAVLDAGDKYLVFAYDGTSDLDLVFASPNMLTVEDSRTFHLVCSDLTTDLTTGTTKAYFDLTFDATLVGVVATCLTAPTHSTTPLTVDVNEDGTSVLSTKLTFDTGEDTTETAATPAVISDASLADGSRITVDVDDVGDTTAGAGLQVILEVTVD